LTALLFTDAPLVGTFHRSGRSDIYDRFRAQVQWCADHLDVRVAVSAEAARTAASALGGDYRVTFNGIEVARFRDAMPIETHGPTVFFIGRHEERKGVGVLVDALVHLPKDVTVWIAGAGPLTAELQRKTAGDSRVQWLGRLTDAELASRMRSADVFVAPSLGGESFGVVLLEAMAAHTATVCSDIPGYRAAAVEGKAAALVPPGDPLTLATTIVGVIGDTARRESLIAAGVQRADQFSMTRLAAEYVSIYQDVLNVESQMARLKKPSGRWAQGVTSWTLWRHRPRRLEETR
jgi:phosphatidylinositol alpha-mannosyltransferase